MKDFEPTSGTKAGDSPGVANPDTSVMHKAVRAERQRLSVLEMDIDITHRKQAEAALKEANEKLEQRVAERTAELEAQIARRKQTEEVLRFLAQCGAAPSGEDFFQELARYLTKSLDMDFVCIDRLEQGTLAATTLAMFYDGKFQDNVTYTLKDTPCGDVVGKTICCFPKDVRGLFPKDAVLQEMLAESYVGTTLWDSKGRPIGLIAVIGRKPLGDSHLAESVLQLVGVRAAGELERREAETALRESERFINSVAHASPHSFYVFDFDTMGLSYSNRPMLLDLGYPLETQTTVTRLDGFRAFMPHEEMPHLARVIQEWQALPDGCIRDDEYRLTHADGSLRYFAGREVVFARRPDGTVQRILGSLLDITKIKQAEAEIQNRAAELRATNEELTRFNNAMIDRELRMIELKKEINELCVQLGQPARYEKASRGG